MKTQLSIQMRILGLKDRAPSLAQPLYDLVLGSTNLQPTLLLDLLAEGIQVAQPGTVQTGCSDQTIDDLNRVSLLRISQGLELSVELFRQLDCHHSGIHT